MERLLYNFTVINALFYDYNSSSIFFIAVTYPVF